MAAAREQNSGKGDPDEGEKYGEETFVISKSSKSDAKFDAIIGHIEDIIMEDEFQELQQSFFEKYCGEFDEEEENRLIYTDIHRQYTELIEKYLETELCRLMPDFNMIEFQKQLISRQKELEGEIFEMLLTFSDFLAFKEMCLSYKADKEGRTVDLSEGLVISPFCVSSSNRTRGADPGGLNGFVVMPTTMRGGAQHQELMDCGGEPEEQSHPSRRSDSSPSSPSPDQSGDLGLSIIGRGGTKPPNRKR